MIYLQSLSFYPTTDDKFNISQCLQKISKMYENQGNYSQAITYAFKALEIADSNNLLGNSKVYYPTLRSTIQNQKISKMLNKCLKRFNDLKDSGINTKLERSKPSMK